MFHKAYELDAVPGASVAHRLGNPPEIIAELRGPKAAEAIGKIMHAVQTYPYARVYHVWPGPNSNTFTAYVARHVPELRLNLPVTAIGKDYPTPGTLVEQAPSGTGYQLSIYGLAGLLIAKMEGIELNLLGLNFGIDLHGPALKIPFIGRLGFESKPTGGPASLPPSTTQVTEWRGAHPLAAESTRIPKDDGSLGLTGGVPIEVQRL